MRPQQHNQIQFAVAILLDDGIELFLPLFGVIEDEYPIPDRRARGFDWSPRRRWRLRGRSPKSPRLDPH